MVSVLAELWHTKPHSQVVVELDTHLDLGLSHAEAARRLRKHGPNKLSESRGISPLPCLWISSRTLWCWSSWPPPLFSFLLGEVVDAAAILAIVLLNAVLGFVQEYRAERSLEALKRLTAPYCKVVRQGEWQKVPTRWFLAIWCCWRRATEFQQTGGSSPPMPSA